MKYCRIDQCQLQQIPNADVTMRKCWAGGDFDIKRERDQKLRVLIEQKLKRAHLIGNYRRHVHVHVRERALKICQGYGVVPAAVVDIENQKSLGIYKCGC